MGMEVGLADIKENSISRGLDIYYLSLILIVVTIPFSIQANTLCITISVFCWLALLFNKQYRGHIFRSLRKNATAILFILYSLVTVLSVIIHFGSYDDVWPMLKTIERRSVFLFVPLVLSGVTLLSRIRIKRLIMLFTQIMIIASLVCLAIGLYATIKNGTAVHINPLNGIVENNFMYHRLVSYLGLHAVFFAAQVCFVFCILLIKFLNRKEKVQRKQLLLFYLQLLFLAGMIILLQSITISITFLLLLIIILLYRMSSANLSKRFVGIALLALILIISGSIRSIYPKVTKGNELFNYELTEKPGPSWNAVNIRLAIWEVNLKAIKDNWLLGVGPSNMNATLQDYYKKYDFKFGIINKLNPHNQFLHTILTLGIGGLLILVSLFGSVIIKSEKRKDLILGSLTFIFLLFSLTASTLAVNKGIVFFTFFLTLLTFLEGSTLAYLAKGKE